MQTTLEANQMDLKIERIKSFKRQAFLHSNRGKIASMATAFIFSVPYSILIVGVISVLGITHSDGSHPNLVTVFIVTVVIVTVLIAITTGFRFNLIYLKPTNLEIAKYYKFKFDELSANRKRLAKEHEEVSEEIDTFKQLKHDIST